jgi:hypothetical protein
MLEKLKKEMSETLAQITRLECASTPYLYPGQLDDLRDKYKSLEGQYKELVRKEKESNA